MAASADCLLADVVFDRPLTTIYQYIVPDGLRDIIGPGQRIQAPFGRGGRDRPMATASGWEPRFPPGRTLKTLESVLDREALIDSRMLSLTRWIADRYLCGWGQVLETVVPKGVKSNAGTRDVTFFTLSDSLRQKAGFSG